VLETLGERIAGGEVDDLAKELPAELRPARKRGKERSTGHSDLAFVAERGGRGPP